MKLPSFAWAQTADSTKRVNYVQEDQELGGAFIARGVLRPVFPDIPADQRPAALVPFRGLDIVDVHDDPVLVQIEMRHDIGERIVRGRAPDTT